jgi:fucose 4-O-acetylase-like acetyltransferase
MKKILWIDLMKGLGMLTVVAGHIYGGEISRNIFIFHMPLFFFISGYLLKPTLEYKKYFTKKVVHLLIPYFSFLIPMYVVLMGFPSLNIKEIIIYISRPIIGGRFLVGAFGVFWFVTCLFLTQQIMNYLINKLNSKKLLLLMLSMLIVSYSNTYVFPKIWFPWNANVIFASAPIFYIGYIYKERTFKMNNVLLTILGISVVLFSFTYPENVYDMKSAKYGIPIITLISSLILILNIKFISVKLSNYKFSYRVLSEIGKASMVIMYLHQPIQMLTNSSFSTNTLIDATIRFFTATILSYVIYLVLSKFKFGKALFLGSYKDLEEIFSPLIKRNKALKANNV